MVMEDRDSEPELDRELSILGLSCEDREGPLTEDMVVVQTAWLWVRVESGSRRQRAAAT